MTKKGVILDFRVISAADKPLFDKYNSKNQRSSYNFITNFIWSGEDKLKICVDDDFLFIFWDIGSHSRMLYPIGFGNDKRGAILKACNYMKKRGITPLFSSLLEEDVLELKELFPNIFLFDYDRNNSDYIYSSEKLINLSGKKLHSKKNRLNGFKRNYNYIYRNIEPKDISHCKKLFDLWYNEKDENTRLLPESKTATYKLLDNLNDFTLIGGLIEVDNEIVACTIGEKITADTALIHVEFANTAFNGSYAAINQQFVEHEWANVPYINREEDMGDEGLRRAKEAYQPIKLLNEYTAKLK